MDPPVKIRVKICCIQDADEARLAIAHGADALGLVGPMPSGPGIIDAERIRAIAATVASPVRSFLLSSAWEAATLLRQVDEAGVTTLQLVDEVSGEVLRALRAARPALELVQVIHVGGPDALSQARAVAPLVDAVLLDSGFPWAPVPELGGTGRTHDWAVSARVVAAIDKPVWLAGGLRPENVAAAVARVRPYGIDICTGVRSDGRLDPAKLAAVMAAVRAAA
jgi:phosphoribosylanthranilate isomerase